jgi:ferredoxin-NADP reductase
MPAENIRRYLVVDKKQETPTITTLLLTLDNGTVPPYAPGQYITIYFYDSSTQNGKPYSISSAPYEKTLAVTIRAVGEFSNRLCSMKYGDTFFASLPQGFLTTKQADANLYIIAAGMGITPFRSMILNVVHHALPRQIFLFYSIRMSKEALFSKELAILAKKYKGLHIKKYVTREWAFSLKNIYRKIKTDDILRTVQTNAPAEFLICGSVSFVCDQRYGLLRAGILDEQIQTEIHFL